MGCTVNVFSDCSAHETLEKYLSKKFQLTKISRQCKLWKIVSNLELYIQLFTMDAIGNTVSLSLTASLNTCHGAALNKVYSHPQRSSLTG